MDDNLQKAFELAQQNGDDDQAIEFAKQIQARNQELPAQQVAPVEQPSGTVDKFFKNLRRVQTDTFDKMYGVKEPDKNMLLGFSGRGEEAAAGVAGMLGFHSQPWQEKIDRQNQWMSENTGTGVGKAAADIAMTVPATYAAPEVVGGALMKPLAQIGQDMGLAGITGAITHPGDAWDRLSNGAIDAVGAGAFSTVGQVAKPVIKYLGGAARTVHDIFTDAGHMSKLADYVRQAVPEDAIQTVISNLENYKQLIPSSVKRGINYKPTAAEAGQHYGLNTLQDYFSSVNPGQYISRELDNIGAESKLMNAIANPKKLAEKVGFRTAVTEPLYTAAKQTMVPVDKELVQLLKRPEMRKAINEAITTGANNGISPPTRTMLNQVLSGKNGATINGDALHHIKLGIDSIIKTAKDPRANLNQRAFQDIRSTFENWRTKNIPEYAEAQSTFQRLSKPVNRRNAAQAIMDKTYPHGINDPAALHKTNELTLGDILADPDELVKSGTDFSGSTFANTFTNRQKDLMSNVSESQRRRAASELTSGTGFQHEVGGGMESRGVGAVAQAASGIPGIYQGVTAKLLSEMTGQNRAIQSRLADILLDPKQTAALFKVGKRPHAMAFMDNSVLNKIPGLVGYLSSNQLINQ
jgi:hypothetical protein